MSDSAAYRQWVTAGRPFRLARPIEQLAAWSAAAGVPLLGTIGNLAHLKKAHPEDHCPFSATQWPDKIGYVVCAVDLGNVRGLGPTILKGCKAGVYPWIKYLNFDHHHYDSREGWREAPSPDAHVHVSIRTDWAFKPVKFDPWGTPPKPAKKPRILGLTDPMMHGDDVGFVQRYIGEKRCGPDDGWFGPATADGVRWYQRTIMGVHPTGIVGMKEWTNMGVL